MDLVPFNGRTAGSTKAPSKTTSCMEKALCHGQTEPCMLEISARISKRAEERRCSRTDHLMKDRLLAASSTAQVHSSSPMEGPTAVNGTWEKPTAEAQKPMSTEEYYIKVDGKMMSLSMDP
mmetsp:Transcript_46813/g.69610  ORF Transcript_46813/g.69610 Transcript_46813/m.69610 type:complete len:121 (+) Transcript_46813:710-1072(+)